MYNCTDNSYLYNVTQIKVIEVKAITDGISGHEMMRRAGQAAFDQLRKQWPEAKHIIVVCGQGNNGGDGLILARLLKQAGLVITVYLLGDPAVFKGDALKAFQELQANGASVLDFAFFRTTDADLIVDALLGIGLARPLTGLFESAVNVINASGLPVMSLDIPSGLNANTGTVMGVAVCAQLTVSFIALKRGLFTGAAPAYCGRIICANLGLADYLLANAFDHVNLIRFQQLPKRSRIAHKGTNGHTLIIGGTLGYSGAIKLAGEAALRVGSGLVSLATRPEHAALMNIGMPELMCHGIETVNELAPLLDKASVVVIGPGLGQSAWAEALLNKVLLTNKPLVVDADGLNLLAKQDFPKRSRDNWILTPHPGEAARLLNSATDIIQLDRFQAVEALRTAYRASVVLKGAGTLIADNHGLALSDSGNPGMASGGMGDVLSGVIAGLCAQQFPMAEAIRFGVHIHGLAADSAAEINGERGLLASDLLPQLQKWVN